MKVVKIEDFYKELKHYPVEMDMVLKSWIREIFNEIQFEIKKTKDGTIISEKERNSACWRAVQRKRKEVCGD